MWSLDPTAEDVQGLDDGQLVELVWRLCRREAQTLGLPTSSVTKGGNPSAKDGGVDIRIAGVSATAGDLLRLPAVIQVKAQMMPVGQITKEMSPDGTLRPAITSALESGGVYIIVSGREDLTDKRRRELTGSMIEQVPEAHADQVSFYDSGQLAVWAARHAGLAAWLRAQANRPVDGWEPWGPWSARDQADDQPYLVDEAARLCRPLIDGDHLHGVLVGLGLVREALAPPRAAVRLTGLSGMGKTRFAQALFDPRVGDAALDPSLVIYGDAGLEKAVSPIRLAQSLVEDGVAAILIVDNCPAKRHRELVEVIRHPTSHVSLLTIDFDVGDHQPDHTEVVRLQNAGEDLIDALLRQRATSLTHSERIRIVEFAGGNTRIALAIALAPPGAKGIVGLKNSELLDRLFLKDRRDPDLELRRVARAASLVYAFSVEGDEAPEAAALAELAGVSEVVFHEKMADLLDRGLAQQRGAQRAILPPAIAAWLAAEALDKLPRSRLMAAFTAFPPRLQRSFSRRLGLLQGVKAAVEIAGALLSPGGHFADPSDNNGNEMRAARYMAPLAPILALDLAERVIASAPKLESWHPSRGELRRLLVDIAYDPVHFERAVDLLAILARTETTDQRHYESVRDKILPMFHIQRSGTHATPEQRFAVIDRWLASDAPPMRALGLDALDTALETRFAGADPQVEFGAERRDSGWWPKSRVELRDWFGAGLDRARALLSDPTRHESGRALIAKHYPALAAYGEVVPAAVRAMQDAAGGTFWPKGWFAACDAVWRLRKRKLPRPVKALERAMRPSTLADEIEVWLRLEWHDWRNPEHADQSRDDWPEAHRRALAAARRAIDDDGVVQRVLGDPAYEGRYLGQGLAEAGAPDFQQGWDRLRRLLDAAGAEKPNWGVFAGYLGVVRAKAPDLADALLDAAMIDLTLRPFAIILCVTDGDTNDRGLSRILTLLRDTRTRPEERMAVHAVRFDDSISVERVGELIDALVEAGEIEQALYLLSQQDQEAEWEQPLRLAGRKALLRAELARADDVNGYWDRRAGKIAERSLAGPEGVEVAAALLNHIVDLGNDRCSWGRGMPVKLTKVLFRLHPKLALDILLPALQDDRRYVLRWLLTEHDDDDRPTKNAFNGVPDDIMRAWLNEDPVVRGPVLADMGSYFSKGPEGAFEWTPLALALLDVATDVTLEVLGDRFESGSSSGRWGSRFVRRRPMVEALQGHLNPRVRAWASDMLNYLDKRIKDHAEWERDPTDRFE